MPQLLPFSLQIFLRMRAGSHLTRHSLHNFNSCLLQRRHFIWIIRKQPHSPNPKRFQYLRRQCKFAMVRLKSQSLVGLDRIQPGILQFISLQLRHQPNAAPFLLFINQNARAFTGDQRQRQLQLLPAIAPQRSKNVSGQALRMNPHQWRRGMNVTHHQRHRLFRLSTGFGSKPKSVNPEPSPAGRKVSRGELLGRRSTHDFIISSGQWPVASNP